MKRVLARLAKVVITCFLASALAGIPIFAQSPLTWRTAQKFDNGVESSIAVTPSGLVIEFHKSQNNNGIFYHVGKVRETWDGQPFVSWGDSQPLYFDCHRPSVAITKQGWVLMACTKFAYSGYGSEVQMRYWAGQLNPDGDNAQTIDWKIMDRFFDTGQYAALSFNTNDILVDVHESAKNSKVFYRVGRFQNPLQGQFEIVWGTGDGGKEYDKGVNPHIAINEWNQVVEVHQTQNNESLLHYRRGHLYADHIAWTSESSFRYDDYSKQPAITLTNQSKVIEAASKNNGIFSRTGNLRPNYARVDWSDAAQVSWSGYPGVSPSIATNGIVAISTWTGEKQLFYAIALVR
jgi:hypothetical protein